MTNIDEKNVTVEQLKAFLDNVPTDVLNKASAVSALTVADATGFDGAAVAPKNTAEWLDLYTKHVWTYVTVYAVASTIAKLPLELIKKNRRTGAIEKIDSHAILDLLAHPNSDMTGYDLKESLVTYLELAGNAYWELVYSTTKVTSEGNTVSSVSQPKEIYNLRPDRVTPKPRKDGRGVEAYIFQTKKNLKKTELKPKNVVPFDYFNPTQDWFGQGSVCSARNEILLDLHMIDWNDGFFADGLIPQGVLTSDKPLTNMNMDDMAKQLKQFLLGRGRKVMILGNNMKWQQVAVKATDVDFAGGRKENKHSILAAGGVPPVMAGMLDNAKYDNYELQLETFHKDTIGPKLKKIESAFTTHLIPRFPDLAPTEEYEYLVTFDTTSLIQEDKDKLTDRINKQLTHGQLTPNEARKMQGYEPYPEGVEGGDDFYMLSSIVPLKSTQTEEGLEQSEDALFVKVSRMEGQLTQAISTMKEELKKELKDELSS